MDKVLERSRDDLTADYVRGLFDYDAVAGTLVWKPRPLRQFVSLRGCNTWNARWAGGPATARRDGYVRVSIDAKRYYAHRVIWLWVTGEWPTLRIDHKDGDPSNLRWDNLRLATGSNNCMNSVSKSNCLGVRGVHLNGKKYCAEIVLDGVKHRLGRFDTIEAAAAAYETAASNLHGKFYRPHTPTALMGRELLDYTDRCRG